MWNEDDNSMIRNIIAVLLVTFLGFYGIIFFFADLGPGESSFSRLTVAFTFYAIVSATIAWLAYPRWQIVLLVLWGCVGGYCEPANRPWGRFAVQAQ